MWWSERIPMLLMRLKRFGHQINTFLTRLHPAFGMRERQPVYQKLFILFRIKHLIWIPPWFNCLLAQPNVSAWDQDWSLKPFAGSMREISWNFAFLMTVIDPWSVVLSLATRHGHPLSIPAVPHLAFDHHGNVILLITSLPFENTLFIRIQRAHCLSFDFFNSAETTTNDLKVHSGIKLKIKYFW